MENKGYELKVFETAEELCLSTAQFIVELAQKAVLQEGRFSIVLSGGNTPTQLYELLATKDYAAQMPWKNTHVFWGDERCLPLEDERNNAHSAYQSLLCKIGIPDSNIHRIPVDLHPADAAKQYEREIKSFFEDQPWQFDLILLGLGENGHTASLFPDTAVLKEHTEGIKAVYVEDQQMFRITFTAPLINKAHTILFLVIGKEKSGILRKILSTSGMPPVYPAQLITPLNGKLLWFADRLAAASIN